MARDKGVMEGYSQRMATGDLQLLPGHRQPAGCLLGTDPNAKPHSGVCRLCSDTAFRVIYDQNKEEVGRARPSRNFLGCLMQVKGGLSTTTLPEML